MQIFDISNVVSPGMVTWPDNPTVAITRAQDQARGLNAFGLTKFGSCAKRGRYISRGALRQRTYGRGSTSS